MHRLSRGSILILLLAAVPLFAQPSDIDIGPLAGRIIPIAPLSPEELRAKTVDEAARLHWQLSTTYLDADGLWLGQATASAIWATEMPVALSFSYSYIDIDGFDQVNGFAGSIRANVWSAENVGGLNLLASYSDTEEFGSTKQAGAVAEFELGETPFSVGADVRWVSDEDTDGIVPAVTFAFDAERITIGADYTFDNDVEEESDYSAELDFTPSKGNTFFVGAGKDSVWFVGFRKLW